VSQLNYVLALQKAGRFADAEQVCLSWLAAHPGDLDGSLCLAGLRHQQGRPGEAVQILGQVIAQDAGRADAWLNLGAALKALGQLAEAEDCFKTCIELAPTFATAHFNLGVVQQEGKRLLEALKCFERAIELRPDYANAHGNCGSVLASLNRNSEAIESLERALALDPGNAIARHNRGLSNLRLGHLDGAAWMDCEYRWKRPGSAPLRHREIPAWHAGLRLEGKRILLWSEQGLGDSVQFCRYANLIRDQGAEPVLEVPPVLKPLLATLQCAGTVCAQGDSLPPCDYALPLLSLPLVFDTRLATIPSQVPYLWAEPVKVAEWSRRLGERNGRPRIGIACSGSRGHKNDANRSIALSMFAPLCGLAQVHLLQPELREEDEAALHGLAIRDLRLVLHDFSDTAAAIACMDLIISVDTSVAHVAGALGKPVWILLPFAPDWRWLLERHDSPWYPAARLFRQPQPGDWTHVLAQITEALRSEFRQLEYAA
jgi:Flp pilus assembly protein TadD